MDFKSLADTKSKQTYGYFWSLFLTKEIVMMINYFVYKRHFYFETKLVMDFVDILGGFILGIYAVSILIDLVKDYRDKNTKYRNWYEMIIELLDDCDLYEALVYSYDFLDPQMKLELKPFVESLKRGNYSLKDFEKIGHIRVMNAMYHALDFSHEMQKLALDEAMHDLENQMDYGTKQAKNKKSKVYTSVINYSYQLICGLGIMTSIIVVLVDYINKM